MPKRCAVQLKEEGNRYFKSRQFAQAAKLYEQAEEVEPGDPVFPSNLSAALYETGDYAGSYQAILRSAKLLSESPNPPLAAKLSSRLPKALTYGLRNRTVSLKDCHNDKQFIEQLKLPTGISDDAWQELERAVGEHDTLVQQARTGRLNFVSLSMARKAARSDLEYFTIGHDDVMSIITDWGSENKGNPFDLLKVSEQRLSCLSFIWGGGGDGRHVYGSIIGLSQAFLELTPDQRQTSRVHFTLLDIHPTTIARNLCLFMMIDELITMRLYKRDDGVQETEIKATIFYVWMGVALPSYCHVRFMNTVKFLLRELQTSSCRLPRWLHVTKDSIPGIVASLRYWDTQLSFQTVQEMLRRHRRFERRPVNLPNLHLKDIKAGIDDMTDEEVFKFGQMQLHMSPPSKKEARQEWLSGMRLMMFEILASGNDGRRSAQFSVEEAWYGITQCFIPPKVLRYRHEAFDELWASVLRSPSQNLKKQAVEHIEATWKPNPSLFDGVQEVKFDYPSVEFNAFEMVERISQFNSRMGLFKKRRMDEDCPAYSVSEIFFDAVVNGLLALKDHIKIELLQGDISQELMKMAHGIDDRPSDFPRMFTRIWLSNVPDYTHGPMNTATFVMPNLEPEPDASVASNCLLNPSIWKDSGDNLIYNYALLNGNDFARFFGCHIVASGPWDAIEFSAKPLPRLLSTLATREELILWLTRVFITTILPPEPPNPRAELLCRVRYPNNLVAFFGLLMRLPTIGYPLHWISEYLNTLLSDNLVTDLVPYRGKFPIPPGEPAQHAPSRRVNLNPWLSELETITALSYEALPFPVSLRLRRDDINTYEAPLSMKDFGPLTLMEKFGNYDPVFSLVFYKRGTPVAGMIQRMNRDTIINVFEKGHGNGEVFVLSVLDQFGITKERVRWKMGKERVAKMQEEKWAFVAYRLDCHEISKSFQFSSSLLGASKCGFSRFFDCSGQMVGSSTSSDRTADKRPTIYTSCTP
ncbi:uncharacterized protein BT62DRAFT_1060778 [Guyanagaster necrorhizus]|uniref:DUF4470 domain-containing protein n=1 Tax=Guyanagaster necrorhizus TaxID=856835 RepID=A0A9P7VXA6_9AGAR|nr:uncharacterized protein BT62DRAFT_1060778 [Guyanagaster necrorhizus MCA 3950]KAG7447536.1 hypothetical protein BT62DRAFT_1060778 [Guyanagaster necrorhizus MCA 3950]